MKLRTIILAVYVCLAAVFVTHSPAAESPGNIVWLDFRYTDWNAKPWPNDFKPQKKNEEINLNRDINLGSAFLRELKRQSVLIAARDELGAITRDAFLGEVVPEGTPADAVKIEDLGTIFKHVEDFDTTSTNLDYPNLLAQWEAYSRNEIALTLEFLGVKKVSLPKATNDTTEERQEETQINDLLRQYALIPNFEAIRRVHGKIRTEGETLPRLKLLVRAYTQMQILTNAMPRDTHRVFQARAVLYAQRAVAKYGNENPELLALRASTWSYCNFPRIARNEFAAFVKEDTAELLTNPYFRLAYWYAGSDLKKIEDFIDTQHPDKPHGPLPKDSLRPFAKLLYYVLQTAYSDRDFGEHLAEKYMNHYRSDLPFCERLYHNNAAYWIFGARRHSPMYMAYPFSPFYEQISLDMAPQIRKMRNCPRAVTRAVQEFQRTMPTQKTSLLASGLDLWQQREDPPITHERMPIDFEKTFPAFGTMIETMRKTTPGDDAAELSFHALATLLEDEQFSMIHVLAQDEKYKYKNNVDTLIDAAEDAIGKHPLYYPLKRFYKNQEKKNQFKGYSTEIYSLIEFPYEAISQCRFGVTDDGIHYYFGDKILPFTPIACCFADRENGRDMLLYHREISQKGGEAVSAHFTELIYELYPKHLDVIFERLRNNENLDEHLADSVTREYRIPLVQNLMYEVYEKHDRPDKMCDIILNNTTLAWHNVRHLVEYQERKYDYASALEHLEKILEHFRPAAGETFKAPYADTLSLAARLHVLQGNFDRGIEYAEKIQDNDKVQINNNKNYLANYYEMVGQFEKGEELLQRKDFRNTYEDPIRTHFGICYRTENPNLVYALNNVFEMFEAEKAKTGVRKGVSYSEMLYVLRCMEASPEELTEHLGKGANIRDYFLNSNMVSGFHAWFDALEKGDEKTAQTLFQLFLGHRRLIPEADID